MIPKIMNAHGLMPKVILPKTDKIPRIRPTPPAIVRMSPNILIMINWIFDG